MPKHLRLHRDDADDSACLPAEPCDDSIPFPGTDRRRNRLVAGTVDRAPTPDDVPESACCTNDDLPEDCAGRVARHPELVRQIEETLGRMQNRLNRFKRQLDDAYKFPPGGKDNGPRPAA